MHELEEYTEAAAVWVVHGAWWVITRDEDTVMGDGWLLLEPPPCPN